MLREFRTRDGYVWKDILDGQILSEVLYLGKSDTIDHYEQVLPEKDVIDEES